MVLQSKNREDSESEEKSSSRIEKTEILEKNSRREEKKKIATFFLFYRIIFFVHVDAFPEPFTEKWFFRVSVFYLVLSCGMCFFLPRIFPFLGFLREKCFFLLFLW